MAEGRNEPDVTPTEEQTYTHEELVTFAALASRMALGRILGQQTAYEGQRQYDEVLGYPTNLVFDDYMRFYQRQDIAGRIVDLPAQDTWKQPPAVTENDETGTPFVRAWDELVKSASVWSMLSRADRLSGIGEYGVLVVGLKDLDAAGNQKKLKEPVKQNAVSSVKDVLYLRPYSEGKADISKWEDDLTSRRYGLPLEYSVKLRENDAATPVHYTRVLHLADGKLDSEVIALPRLQRVVNRLHDLIKLVGGTAEATWLNMRPPMVIGPKEGWQDNLDEDDWIEAVRSLTHDLPRIMRAGGLEAQVVGTGQVLDPKGPFEVEMALLAAAAGIPQRVLIGSAGGELSAAKEDTRQWGGQITERQQNYAEPEVLRPFIDLMIWYGVLPMPQGGPDAYDVGTLDPSTGVRLWPSIVQMDEGERAEITLKDAQAAKTLADPVTGQFPITDEEKRELLGYPPLEGEEAALAAALAVNNEAAYAKSIRDSVRGLWSGVFNVNQFIDSMIAAIQIGLDRAFQDGAKKAGVAEVELTQEEMVKLNDVIADEINHVLPFANDVSMNDKSSGAKLGPHITRTVKWGIRYREVVNLAMTMARTNPKQKWNIGPTESHCRDCANLNNRVYRASTWRKWGVRPQSKELACQGFECLCFFSVTDEPVTKGRPPNLKGP